MQNQNPTIIRGRLTRIGAWIALACAFSAAVHLIGPWPDKQIFLYVDGFSNIRTFGETALLAWLILAGAAVMQKNISPIYLACLILASTLIFWSGTRAAWVGMFAAIIITVIATRKWSRAGLIVGATLLGLAGSLLLPLPGNEYGAWRFQKLAQETSDATQIITQKSEQTAPTQEERPKSVRTALWKWGFSQTFERPLTGHGMGGLELDKNKPKYLNFAHLHNFVLDMAYWYGWPMTVLLLGWMTFQWFFLVAASWKRNPLAPTFLMMSTGLSVCALFAGTFMFPITLMAGVIAFSSGRILHSQTT